MRSCVVLLASSLIIFRAAAALAAEPASSQGQGADAVPIAIGFDWTRGPGAETCTDGEALRRAAEAQLQRPAFVSRDEAEVFVRGRVAPTADGQGYEAQLFLVAGDGTVLGQRILRSERPDCASLDEPLALVMALAVDTLRSQPMSSLRIASRRTPWHAELAPLAVFEWGLLPDLGIGFGLDVVLQAPSAWMFDVSLAAWPFPNRAEGVAGRGAEFRAYLGALVLCRPLARSASAQLRGCAGFEAGRVTGTGVALDVSRPRSGWIAGPEVRMDVLWPFGRNIALEARAGLVVPFVRDGFTYTDEFRQEQPVHRPAPVLLMVDLGLPLRIP